MSVGLRPEGGCVQQGLLAGLEVRLAYLTSFMIAVRCA